MTLYWTAFILGLGGSVHCAGMCSPLAVALTATRSGNHWKRKIIYNFGRITTYAMLGGLVGWLGNVLNWTSYQDLISAGLGVLLIVIAVAGLSQVKITLVTPSLQAFTLILKKLFSRFLAQPGMMPVFFMGMINGFLPCGLTYLALTSCVAVPGPVEGILFMMVFGAGTLGVMLGFSGMVSSLIRSGKFQFQRVTTILLFVAGALLITRAMVSHSEHPDHSGHVTILCR